MTERQQSHKKKYELQENLRNKGRQLLQEGLSEEERKVLLSEFYVLADAVKQMGQTESKLKDELRPVGTTNEKFVERMEKKGFRFRLIK